MFLDINMPHLTGLEFLESLDNPPLTIITTAYSEYALDGFRLDVVDYLLKPIPFQRFFQAVSKAQNLHQAKLLNTNPFKRKCTLGKAMLLNGLTGKTYTMPKACKTTLSCTSATPY